MHLKGMTYSCLTNFKNCFFAATLTVSAVMSGLVVNSDASELSILTANDKIWESNATTFSNKFQYFDWEEEDNWLEYRDEDLKLWGEKVSAVKLIEEQGVLVNLNFELVSKDDSQRMSKKVFDTEASKWKSSLDAKLGVNGKVMVSTKMGDVSQVRIGWAFDKCILILSAHYGKSPQLLEISFYERSAGVAQTKLRGQLLDKPIANHSSNNGGSSDSDNDIVASTKEEKEIRNMIREISARKAPAGVSRKVQDAVNLLNVYRYLSSVPYNVKASQAMIKAAEDAAGICKEKGQLSHDFGHSTDKCNLAMNSGNLTMENSVMQYMNDSGANNRAARGHRMWCLNPKMGKTGFGIVGAYSAMYSLDQSAREGRKNYSYPGHGFYPIKYLHGNGWSYYIVDGPVPANVKVEVWKLNKKEDRLPSFSKEPDGRKLPVAYTNVNRNNVVFEPESSPITKKGYYLVRIVGSGLKKQYLVKLF